jgi:hypothetical protein
MGRTFVASAKAADAPDIEADFYDARFDSIDQKFIPGGQYGDGDRFVWAFTLLDDDGAVLYSKGEPVEVDGLTSMSLNILSKTTPRAVRYLKALMTEAEFADFTAGNGIDADALIGRKVQVEVIIRDTGWPTVVNVLPARKSRKGGRPAPVSEDGE